MTEVEGREGDMILPLTAKCRSLFVRPVMRVMPVKILSRQKGIVSLFQMLT